MKDTDSKGKIKLQIIITKSNFGGAQRYVYDLATNLPQDKYDTEVICGGNGSLVKSLKNAKIKTRTIKALDRDVNVYNDIATFFALIKIFWQEKPDIIHLNSSKIGTLGAIAGRITGVKKIIFTAHAWAFNDSYNKIIKNIIKLIHWFTIILSHKTIVVSKKTLSQMDQMPWIKNKMICIYNGIKTIPLLSKQESKEFLADINNNLKSKLNNPWIGTFSELHPVKGLDIAIESFATINKTYPNYKFIICGEGKERENLENIIRKHKLEETVFLIGFVSSAYKYIKAFDVFTLSSRSEALPYAILEAGISATPVIATDVGGISEIIENNSSGILVKPNNINNLTEGLIRLISNPEIARNYGSNLQTNINNKFTLEKMISETIKIYNI